MRDNHPQLSKVGTEHVAGHCNVKRRTHCTGSLQESLRASPHLTSHHITTTSLTTGDGMNIPPTMNQQPATSNQLTGDGNDDEVIRLESRGATAKHAESSIDVQHQGLGWGVVRHRHLDISYLVPVDTIRPLTFGYMTA